MFRETGGIRVVDDGTVWVGDIYNRRAQQFNQNGEYLSQIYLPAAHPTDFMLDAQGRLLVLDGLQQIIRRFDADGNRVADLGKRGGGLGEFAGGPGSIDKDEHGRIWVVSGMPTDGDLGYQGRWNVQEEEAERLTGRRKPLLPALTRTDGRSVELKGHVTMSTSFGRELNRLAQLPEVRLVLEIGTWFGGGSSWW
jgi:hypothetical protein